MGNLSTFSSNSFSLSELHFKAMVDRADWTFLLQQEGDQSWLPLESPDVEILEGRYRILARSRYKNADLVVRMSHESLSTGKSLSRQRSIKTDAQGLAAVLTFTGLQPGLWHIDCRGQNWQHSVQLHVLAKVEDEDWDWEPTSPDLNAPAAQTAGAVALDNGFGLEDGFGLEGGFGLEDGFGQESASTAIEPIPTALDLSLAFEMDPVAPEVDSPEFNAIAFEALDLGDLDSAEFSAMSLGELELEMPELETPELETPALQIGPPQIETLGFEELDDADLAGLDHPLDPFDLEISPSKDSAAESIQIGPRKIETLGFGEGDGTILPISDPFDVGAATLGFSAANTADPTVDSTADAWADSLDELDFTEPEVALASTMESSSQESPVEPPAASAIDPAALSISDVLGNFAVDSHLSLAQESTAAFAAIKAPVPTLSMDLDLYAIVPGQYMNLTGRVAADTPGVLSQGELVAILRDPQAAKVVAQQRLTLQNQPLPIPFALPLAIPVDLQAQLLIGELTLWNDGVDVLAQQTFTAIASPEQVQANLPEPPVPEPKVPVREKPMNQFSGVDFSFFDLIGDAPQSVEGEGNLPGLESIKDVNLPNFQPPQPIETFDNWGDATDLADPLADDPLDFDSWGLDGANDELGDASLASTFDATLDLQNVVEPSLPDLDLADDLDLSDSLSNFNLGNSGETQNIPLAPEDLDFHISDDLFESHRAQEVVIDDLPERPPVSRPAANAESNPLMIPDAEAVPVPVIQVLDGELVTGQAIQVKVMLPNLLAKLYVKLWIHDRQSRTMLDGPRWLVDFVPNGKEALEAVTQLTVPFGSVQIQIAAIAVEVATKRESYRATVDRTVVPPSLGDDLSDFDLTL